MWLATLLGCFSVPKTPYRIPEATGVFSSWRKGALCVCNFDALGGEVRLDCGDNGVGSGTLILPITLNAANQRIAGVGSAQIEMGGLNSSTFIGGPAVWEYSNLYEEPPDTDQPGRYRDIIVHELIFAGGTVTSPLDDDPAELTLDESRLKGAFVCIDPDQIIP